MKIQKFENYLKDKFKWYIKEYYDVDKFGIRLVLANAPDDHRLAYVAQTYYEVSGKEEYVKRLMPFNRGNKILGKDNKYVMEYDRLKDCHAGAKMYWVERISKMVKGKVSYYKLAKMINTSPSNIKYCFEGDTTKLSNAKLELLWRKVREEYPEKR